MSDADRELKYSRLVFLGSFSFSVLLSLVLISRDPGFWAATAAVLMAFTAVSLLFMGWLFRRGIHTGAFLALAVLNLLIVIPELALRCVDFRHVAGIQFGYPRPNDFLHYAPDRDLFWKLPESRPDVNSLGLPGEEPLIPKPPGVFRILFFGDSCMQMGYPERVEGLLGAGMAKDGFVVECVNMAVAGYSSHQGRVLAAMHGERLDPDLVIISYGWNDHWLAFGAVDEKIRISPFFQNLYNSIRLLQAARKVSVWLGPGRSMPLAEVRVPLDRYRTNLTAMQEVFEKSGVPVVFMTASSAHQRLGVPDYLVRQRFAMDEKTVVELHEEYNEVLRALAGESGAPLLDLAAEFGEREDLERIFVEDGIHFTNYGMDLVAGRIARFIGSGGYFNTEQRRSSAG